MSSSARGAVAPVRIGARGPGARAGRLSILHIITRLDRGGSSDCTLWQAIGAARRGHRVVIACGPAGAPTSMLETARREAGLTFVLVPHLVRSISPLLDARGLLSIIRLLRSGEFDIVHTHTSKAGCLGRVAALLTGARGRVIHQPHGHLFYGYYGPVGTALVTAVERVLAPCARFQITLSRRGIGEHLKRGIGRADNFKAIPSGIDLRPFRRARERRDAARLRLGHGPDDVVVGSLCRLEHIKGVMDLLDGFLLAAKTRPRLRLFLGGDGPLRDPLLRRARESGLGDRVTAGTWVAPADVLPALDIFVLASRNEGMGRALVEAMACGLPSIASAVGGVPEVLDDGRAGVLVPPGEPEAIAAAIGRICDDRGLALSLGAAARARAVAYGAGRMVHAVLELYDEVAS